MIDLIQRITGLSKNGVDPATHFLGKDQDRKLATRLSKNYNLTRGGWAYDATQIEDKALQFTIHLFVG